jgi:hypothetical protein
VWNIGGIVCSERDKIAKSEKNVPLARKSRNGQSVNDKLR